MQNFGVYSRLSFYLASRNLTRHYAKSLLAVVIGMLTVILLVIYAGNIESTRNQLLSLPEAMEVTGRISNLEGSQDTGLAIKEKTIDGIIASEEVTDRVFSVQLRAGFGEFTPEEWEGNLNYFAAGINDIAAVSGLKQEEIQFLDQEDERVFGSHEASCVMDAAMMEENGLELGDEVTLTFFYYRYGDGLSSGHEIFIDPLVAGKKYRIVGVMDIKEYLGSFVEPGILLPFENVRDIYHEAGIEFKADAASFRVRDPFRLNECKNDMHDIGLLPVARDAEYQYDGNALTIRDDIFINAAENLRETMAILMGMLPFIIVIIVFVGYLCSYLLIQGRKAEYATMRSVGTGWGYCFFLLLLEHVLLEILACAAVSLPLLLSGGVSGIVLLFADAVFMLSFIAGSAGALWSFHSLSVMEVLSAGE